MAYNEENAERIADILRDVKGITTKQMFGGLCFLLDGNMLIGVDKEDIMVRIGKERHDEYLTFEGAREMDFTKRPMRNFLFIDETGFQKETDLQAWVDRCLDFVSGLPKK
jgi:TfoX/Sxy family transcriptional regulator of competence genes